MRLANLPICCETYNLQISCPEEVKSPFCRPGCFHNYYIFVIQRKYER